jgi:hypothetical protein
MINRPNSDEYAPYAVVYVNAVPYGADVLQVLVNNQAATYNLFHNMTEEQAMHAMLMGNGR